MLRDLIDTYQEKRVAYEEAAHENYLYVSSLENEADTLCELAEKRRLAAKRAKLDFNQKNPPVYWFDEVVVPLFNRLATKAGMECKISSPRGIGAKCSIYLFPLGTQWSDVTRSWDNVLHLSVEPDLSDGFSLWYETGDVADRYPANTLGAINGLNAVTERLPDDPDEILQLFRKVK